MVNDIDFFNLNKKRDYAYLLSAMIFHGTVPYLLFGSPPPVLSAHPNSKCLLSKPGSKEASVHTWS